jgi:hypothetical protein
MPAADAVADAIVVVNANASANVPTSLYIYIDPW